MVCNTERLTTLGSDIDKKQSLVLVVGQGDRGLWKLDLESADLAWLEDRFPWLLGSPFPATPERHGSPIICESDHLRSTSKFQTS